MISRGQWGARAPAGTLYRVAMGERVSFTVHYFGDIAAPADHGKCDDLLRQAQAHHQAKGWVDLGYNDAVCDHGHHFEGRGSAYVGAHNPGHNRNGLGVLWLGGNRSVPSEAAKLTLRVLYDLYSLAAGRPLAKKAHRDDRATACPGAPLTRWVHAGMPVVRPARDVLVPPATWTIELVDACPAEERGVLVLDAHGAVYTFGGARFRGSYFSEFMTEHRNVPRRFTAIQAIPGGYEIAATTGERYRFT
jgi:hypothetical protein